MSSRFELLPVLIATAAVRLVACGSADEGTRGPPEPESACAAVSFDVEAEVRPPSAVGCTAFTASSAVLATQQDGRRSSYSVDWTCDAGGGEECRTMHALIEGIVYTAYGDLDGYTFAMTCADSNATVHGRVTHIGSTYYEEGSYFGLAYEVGPEKCHANNRGDYLTQAQMDEIIEEAGK